MHKCKYIKWLQGVSPTENVNYIVFLPYSLDFETILQLPGKKKNQPLA